MEESGAANTGSTGGTQSFLQAKSIINPGPVGTMIREVWGFWLWQPPTALSVAHWIAIFGEEGCLWCLDLYS